MITPELKLALYVPASARFQTPTITVAPQRYLVLDIFMHNHPTALPEVRWVTTGELWSVLANHQTGPNDPRRITACAWSEVNGRSDAIEIYFPNGAQDKPGRYVLRSYDNVELINPVAQIQKSALAFSGMSCTMPLTAFVAPSNILHGLFIVREAISVTCNRPETVQMGPGAASLHFTLSAANDGQVPDVTWQWAAWETEPRHWLGYALELRHKLNPPKYWDIPATVVVDAQTQAEAQQQFDAGSYISVIQNGSPTEQ